MPKAIPDLHAFMGNQFEATCGRCLRRSVPLQAPNATLAWAEYVKNGWTAYRHSAAARLQAVCPQCSSEPVGIERNARADKSGRLR